MKKFITLIVVIISVATVISGLVQMIIPRFVLGFVGAEITPSTAHFFAIIGMFMTLFGCLMIHTIYSATPATSAVLWCAFQKLGASIAVAIGIMHSLFSVRAGAVAAFDFCSAILFFYYIKLLNANEVG